MFRAQRRKLLILKPLALRPNGLLTYVDFRFLSSPQVAQCRRRPHEVGWEGTESAALKAVRRV